jgi:hypothetical protein
MIEFKDKNYLYVHYIDNWTKPFYVGIGKNYRCTAFSHRGKYWNNIVKKYGLPKVKIIQYFETADDSKIAEKALIGFFGRRFNNSGILVNITLGGDGYLGRKGEEHPMYGKPMSKEAKEKASNKLKGMLVGEKNGMFGRSGELNPFYGKKHTEEHKQRQRETKKGIYNGEKNPFFGKTHSVETKKYLSEKMIGKSMSEETRKKVSETLKMIRKNNPERWGEIDPINFNKSILLLDQATGVYYYSYTDAEKYYKYHRKLLKKMTDGIVPNKTNLIRA